MRLNAHRGFVFRTFLIAPQTLPLIAAFFIVLLRSFDESDAAFKEPLAANSVRVYKALRLPSVHTPLQETGRWTRTESLSAFVNLDRSNNGPVEQHCRCTGWTGKLHGLAFSERNFYADGIVTA
jgi:hypothetical protein